MKRPTRLRPSQGGRFAPPVARVALSDPVTDGARHRCFICGEVTINGRRYAVCAECDEQHGIREKWAEGYGETEARHERDETRECFCPGWLWMNEDDDASFNIERCDTCRTFSDDREAATTMISRCGVADVDWS